ncbi:hypothetical protein VARIO8X_140030 [Burkholderiales bacterium 8X]|nr:hypothetical protein VARIO8X_140030 [Burkholderiales bacterium 8X]
MDQPTDRDGALTLTGADRGPYALGEPMWLWDEQEPVGTVYDIAHVAETRQLRLGGFRYADSSAARRSSVRRLLLFEVVSHVVRTMPQIDSIYITLNHRLGDHQSGPEVANARSRLLRAMRAEEIRVIPGGGVGGDMAVEAIWRRAPAHLSALSAGLAAARRENIDPGRTSAWTRLRHGLQRFLSP